ncbi:MAG: hypothetical protein GXP62_10575 [Oligoflexia bacterium]|nr:hypothetical protein [Oligoflexia bacterium]
MILALLLTSIVHADPGRTTAGLTVGTAGWNTSSQALSVRGHADYGVVRHLTVRAELGTLSRSGRLTVAAGPQLDLIDSRWWRVGLTALPELVLVGADAASQTWSSPIGPIDLGARAGLRVDWLLFWGLSLSARLDRVGSFSNTAKGGAGFWEGGAFDGGIGLAVRL